MKLCIALAGWGVKMSNCPACGSNNTKKMQMVWASGSRTSQSKSTGVGLSSRGTIGVGVGRGTSHSQSHLAASCAPPQKSKLPIIVCALLVLAIWAPLLQVTLSGFNGDSIFNTIFGLPFLALATYGIYKVYQYLDKQNKAKIESYSKTWICLKCGDSYQ